MNKANYNALKPLMTKSAAIDAAQALVAVGTNKIKLQLMDADAKLIMDEAAMVTALGQSTYNTLVAGVKTSLSTALGTAETANDSAITAIT